MSYVVLARKYRPTQFEDFVGQEVVAQTLRNAIRLGRVGHAYLFCGPRGVGKTSMARVFASALNCEKGPTEHPCGVCSHCVAIAAGEDLDVIEIDGASNRSIDHVREIRENANYVAARSRFKIYYIDEVHMLTAEAFNALLKTLEEPPAHVKFFLATTAAAKVPETILSRVQRFDFRRISTAAIARRLREIGQKEGIPVGDDVCLLLAKRGRGSMRDALSLFDQVISFAGDKPSLDEVTDLLGILDDATLEDLLQKVRRKDAAALIRAADDFLARGLDATELIEQVVQYLRDILVARVCGPDEDLLDRPADAAARLVEIGRDIPTDAVLSMIEILRSAQRRLREGLDERTVLEMALIRMAESSDLRPLGELIERMAALEETLGPTEHTFAPAVAAAPSSRPAPAAQPRESTGPLPGSLEEIWTRLLEAAHAKNSSWLYFSLSKGRLLTIENGEATVAFAPSQEEARAEVEQAGNRRALEAILSDLLGTPMRLRCVIQPAEETEIGSVERQGQPPASDDEVVSEIVRAFDGKVVRVETGDEPRDARTSGKARD